MGRNWEAFLLNKNLIELMIMAALTIAGIFIIRQIHHVSAATPEGQVDSINLKTSSSSLPADNTSGQAADPASASDSHNSNRTNVTINGQTIPADGNGDVSQTVSNGNSTTTVKVRNSGANTGQASNTSDTSVNVDVSSSSSTSGGGQ